MQLERISVIYEKYYLRVMKAANDIVHDYHSAQDICQEVFVQLLRVYDHIDEELIGPWLIVNTRRRAIDMYRRALQEQNNGGLEEAEKVCDSEDVEKRVEIKDLQEQLFRRLEQRSPDWYSIIMRLVIDNDRPEEVARDMGISVPHMRMKLSRARTWIRKNFGEYHRDL